MEIDRARTCCFTGHRPEKLAADESALKAMLKGEIEAAIGEGYDTFISGMARGIDICAAEEVVSAAERHAGVRLICAFPFAGCADSLAEAWRARSHRAVARAALCVDVSPNYSAGCYQKRNEWMVGHSSRLIAVYNGTRGGTHNTLVSAAREGLDVRVVLI